MPYKDPEVRKAKQKQYSRNFYLANREKAITGVRNRKRSLYVWWRNLKASLGCFSCEENDPECIDFHHVIADGKRFKEDSANHWVFQQHWGRERILEGLWMTCVPLCSNCHRKVHVQHRRWLEEEKNATAR